jgi:hypothetical protein
MKYAPTLLEGVYGADIAARATSGGTNLNPAEVIPKGRAIVTQEAYPMIVGFGLPTEAATAIKSAEIGRAQESLLRMEQGGKPISRIEYYISEPVKDVSRAASKDYENYINSFANSKAAPTEIGYIGSKIGELVSPVTPDFIKSGYLTSPKGLASDIGAVPARVGNAFDAARSSVLDFAPDIYGGAERGVSGAKRAAVTLLESARPYVRIIAGDTRGLATVGRPATMASPSARVSELFGFGKTPSPETNSLRLPTAYTEGTSTNLVEPVTFALEGSGIERVAYPESQPMLGKGDPFYSRILEYINPVTRLIPASTFGESRFLPALVTPESAGRVTRGGRGGGIIEGGGGTTRITGTKVVGGRTIPSLGTEASLRSQGINPSGVSGETGAGNIGQRYDFRGRPASETMKPMGKSGAGVQAAGLESLVMTESLPDIASASAPKSIQQQFIGAPSLRQEQRIGTVQVIEPYLTFSQQQERRTLPTVLQATSPVITSASRSVPVQTTSSVSDVISLPQREEKTAPISSFALDTFRSPYSESTPEVSQRSRQDVTTVPDITRITRVDQTEIQTPRTTFDKIPYSPQLPIVTPIPPTGLPSVFGGGGSGGSAQTRQEDPI